MLSSSAPIYPFSFLPENLKSKTKILEQQLYLFKSSNKAITCEKHLHPAGIYFFKVNKGITGTACEIWVKLTIKTQRLSDVFMVNFEHNFIHCPGVYEKACIGLWHTSMKKLFATVANGC